MTQDCGSSIVAARLWQQDCLWQQHCGSRIVAAGLFVAAGLWLYFVMRRVADLSVLLQFGGRVVELRMCGLKLDRRRIQQMFGDRKFLNRHSCSSQTCMPARPFYQTSNISSYRPVGTFAVLSWMAVERFFSDIKSSSVRFVVKNVRLA